MNKFLIKKSNILQFYFIIFLFSSLMLNFSWDILPHRFFIYVIFFSGLISLLIKPQVDKIVIYLWVLLGILNVFSSIYSTLVYNIDIYKGWIIQMFLFPLVLQFILHSVQVLGIYKSLDYIKKLFYFYFIINLFSIFLMTYNGLTFDFDFSGNVGEILISLMHSLNQNMPIIYEYGLSRTYLSYFLIGLFILSYAILSIKERLFFVIYSLFATILLGAKAPLLGLLSIIYLLYLKKIKMNYVIKIIIVYISLIMLFIFIFIFTKEINAAFIADGRYIFPVYFYSDFWYKLLGVGMGNYSVAAFKEIFLFHTDLISPLYHHHTFYPNMSKLAQIYGLEYDGMLDILYPVAESDLLFFSISIGSIFTVILIYYICKIFYKNLILFFKYNNTHQVQFFLLFIFLLITSILQDYFNGVFSFLFFGFLLVFHRMKNKQIH